LMLAQRVMLLSMLVVGFGAIGLLQLFVTDAHAACPPPSGFRYIGGACYRVKGVEVDAEVNHTGQLRRNPKKFFAEIAPGPFGIVFCANKPGKQPPGQKIVPVETQNTLKCEATVDPDDVVSSQNGGTAQVGCTAVLMGADLRAYDKFCPSGQHAIDFVPITFSSVLRYADEDDEIEGVLHRCTLPNPETLAWDRTLNRPEPREFECPGDPEVPPAP
jgi:hypothetical protein